MTNETYWKIYNRAYEIYSDGSRSEGAQYNDMQKYLQRCIDEKKITPIQKCTIAASVIKEFIMEVG